MTRKDDYIVGLKTALTGVGPLFAVGLLFAFVVIFAAAIVLWGLYYLIRWVTRKKPKNGFIWVKNPRTGEWE